MKPGTHEATVIKYRTGKAGTGTPQVGVLFETTDSKERIVWYGTYTSASLDITISALEAMGWDGKDVLALDSIVGSVVRIVVEEETGEDGKTFSRVRWVNRLLDVGMKKELTETETKSLRSQVGAYMKARAK